ncbi:MAG TPA: PQQ-dependent sugar dehydrogenase [Candidatus Limnocylindria bacterium]
MSRVRLATFATLLLSLTILLPTPAMAAAPSLSTSIVQNGLTIPWDVAFGPSGQMFVTERPGRVRVYATGRPGAALLATTTIPNVRALGEAGLMGIALDHNFASNRFAYLCVSRQVSGTWRNQVIKYHVDGGWKLDFDRYIIRNGMRANTIHNGCAVEEGPDGKLWITMGDANHPMDAQNPNRLNGKVLRVNRNGTVPADNPVWPGHSGPTVVYSIGHRNPQGISFEPITNRVFAAEHGPDRDDEINWIRAGRNYGWPCVTGNNHPNLSCSGTFTRPAWSSEGPTLATSGAVFVTDPNWESWNRDLFVATLKESDLRRFTVNADTAKATMRSTLFNGRWGRLRAATLGPGGKLYLTTSNGSNDKVVRITPN